MAAVQVKVFYGDNFERCKTVRFDKKCLEFTTFQEFGYSLINEVGTYLEGKSLNQVRMQYKDDEGTFVSMISDEDLTDALRCLSPVPNNEDIWRLSVRVSSFCTPKVPTKNAPHTSTSSSASQSASSSGTARRSLLGTVSKDSHYKSPLDVYLEEKKKAVESQKDKIKKLSEMVNSKEASYGTESRTRNKGPVCGNCHMEGHNRLHCEFGQCLSVRFCNLLSKHTEEKKELTTLKKKLKEEELTLAKLVEEREAKAAAAKSIEGRFSYRVRGELIKTCPEKYLLKTHTGQQIENWKAINRDSKILEKHCKGNIPDAKEIESLLSRENAEDETAKQRQRKVTSVRNPYKRLWEERGVQWPSKPSCTITSPSANTSHEVAEQSNTESTASACSQLSYEQDDYLLNLAIKQSLDDRPANIQHVKTTTHSDAKVSGSGGLSLLADAIDFLG